MVLPDEFLRTYIKNKDLDSLRQKKILKRLKTPLGYCWQLWKPSHFNYSGNDSRQIADSSALKELATFICLQALYYEGYSIVSKTRERRPIIKLKKDDKQYLMLINTRLQKIRYTTNSVRLILKAYAETLNETHFIIISDTKNMIEKHLNLDDETAKKISIIKFVDLKATYESNPISFFLDSTD